LFGRGDIGVSDDSKIPSWFQGARIVVQAYYRGFAIHQPAGSIPAKNLNRKILPFVPLARPPCQREADAGQSESIEAFCNNTEASTGEEGDRSLGWEGVEEAVHSSVPW
jgi:hypothetical protein